MWCNEDSVVYVDNGPMNSGWGWNKLAYCMKYLSVNMISGLGMFKYTMLPTTWQNQVGSGGGFPLGFSNLALGSYGVFATSHL